jgi:Na+-translocating ferredoxin:NAD+ oxidoreductase RnfG subunit
MNKDGFYALRIHPIIFMALITIVCIVITSALYLYTADRVQSNELFFLRRSVLDAAAVEHDGTPASVQEAYTSFVTEEDDRYIIEDESGETKAVVEKNRTWTLGAYYNHGRIYKSHNTLWCFYCKSE